MSDKPKDLWRLSDWYTLREAAYLAANIDPDEGHLTDEQLQNVEICKAALGRAAANEGDSKDVKLHTVFSTGRGDHPDENQTQLSAEWVRRHLSSKGILTDFFFSDTNDLRDAYRDPNHAHYSVELHLAVKAWEALESEQSFPKGPKQAILDWIIEHTKDWPDEKRPGKTARERIMVMVNWKKEGGANRTP